MRFGANEGLALHAMSDAVYKELGLNQMTVLSFWAHDPDLNNVAWRAGVLAQLGYKLAIHPGVYALPPAYRSDPAPWPEDTADYAAMSERVAALARIVPAGTMVDVVNEPFNSPPSVPWEDLYAVYATHGSGARINEYDLLTGHITDDFVKACRGKGDLYEHIGIQAHVFIEALKVPRFDQMSRQVYKLYDTLGKLCHISECSVSSTLYGNDERAQADQLYRWACWAIDHPRIKSFSLWDLIDTLAWHSGSGILRADGTKKLAFTALQAAFAGRSWSLPPKRAWYLPPLWGWWR